MFRFTTKIQYGFRASLNLARAYPRALSVQDIAESEHIPFTYLERILLDLKRNGILKSKRGPKGGFTLSKSPERISIYDIFHGLEGPIAFADCMLQQLNFECDVVEKCIAKFFYKKMKKKIEKILKEYSIRDLLKDSSVKIKKV